MKQITICILLLIQTLLTSAQHLSIKELTTDYKKNPIGIGNAKPCFSWKLFTANRGVLQTAYELRVGTNLDDIRHGKKLYWTSGKIDSEQSIHISYKGPALESRQRYYWQVRVWDNQGNHSAWSDVQFWEMGLKKDDWTAKWIEAATITNGKVGPVPLFVKPFTIQGKVRSARLYITAHGIYEAKLNGKRVGQQLFAPGWTSYHKRLQYQTYDVTDLLQPGDNMALVTIGDGWYRGFLEWNGKRNWYGKEVGLLYQLEITLTDGTKQVMNSDGSWKSSFDGAIRNADLYHGETFDARLDQLVTAGTTSRWKGVRISSEPLDNLVPQEGPTVIKHEQFKPIKVIQTPKGETVLDFGQNLVGWIQIKIKGNAGDTLRISHAEVLDKAGNFYTANLRSAKQEDQYILNGKEQLLEPHFTFHGFRYARIQGLKTTLQSDNFTAVAIYSDMQPTGSFTSSNALINQLQHNIQWGQKGNFVDVPTDCPQRDERLGWTGDAQVFFNTAAYNMNVASFFSKWLLDVKADQYSNGRVPAVIPMTHERGTDGSAGWADVVTIIPWNFYKVYGDTQLLERQYSSMKAWVDYISSVSKNDLWNTGAHYGDWLFYTMADDRDGKAAITDKYLIAQAFYAASTQNVLNAAQVLGKQADVATYTTLLKDIKAAFNREYVTPSGRLVSSSQTAYVLALNFDLLPEDLRAQAAKRLVDNVKAYKNHLTTGFLGTPYLCHVLSRFGYTDVAYDLLLQETYPSWLYPVKMGATTIWERWDGIKTDGTFQTTSMNSFNHYAYGAIGDWMYKVIGGIRPDAHTPGYKSFLLAPQLGGNFTSAAAELETLYGQIKSAWKIEQQQLSYNVVVPPNTIAKVVLPQAIADQVRESSKKLSDVKGLKNLDTAPDQVTFTIGSGVYHFVYPLKNNKL